DQEFRSNVEKILGPDEPIGGSISGMVEAVNFHNTNRFTLYPVIGPKRVSGMFPQQLRPRIKEAIGTFVTVSGRLYYKTWAVFPHSVFAESVDIPPPEDKLPRLSEMRGAFPNLTGGMSSVEFVERIRNENW